MKVNVQQRVLKVISEVTGQQEHEIKLAASLDDDLEMDSLQRMTLYIALEDEFQNTLPPEEVTGLSTVNDIIDFVDKKLQDSRPA